MKPFATSHPRTARMVFFGLGRCSSRILQKCNGGGGDEDDDDDEDDESDDSDDSGASGDSDDSGD